jgi:hypothetical protein
MHLYHVELSTLIIETVLPRRCSYIMWNWYMVFDLELFVCREYANSCYMVIFFE